MARASTNPRGAVPKKEILLGHAEGEFATLRERYGYVLVGKGGETPADPRSAELVAQKLLELHASAVCDLYEMKPGDRHRWVRLFLEALIDAPKRLWQAVIVIIDEAQLFVPEKGAGESEAADAMIGLATRGRKRGFCAVWATQRLAKVRKDAAAELQNVLIGSTFIDVDRERAAEALGIARADKPAFFDQIKVLPEGHFFGLGRAIALERVLVKIGPVTTTHPEPGSAKHAAEPPPAPHKVRALLPKLADLPAEAEQRSRTLAELQADNARLKRELREAQKATPTVPAPKERRVEIEIVKPATVKAIERTLDRADSAIARAVNLEVRLREDAEAARARGAELGKLRDDLVAELRALRVGRGPASTPAPVIPLRPTAAPPVSPRTAGIREQQARPAGRITAVMVSRSAEPGSALPAGEHRVLTAIAQHGDAGVTREQLTILAGYKKSTRDLYVQRLRTAGHVEAQGDRLVATDAGMAALGDGFEPLPTGDALRAYWLQRLPEGERRLLQVLVDAHPKAVDREAISEAAGYRKSTRDLYLQRLAARRLIVAEGRGAVRAAEALFG